LKKRGLWIVGVEGMLPLAGGIASGWWW